MRLGGWTLGVLSLTTVAACARPSLDDLEHGDDAGIYEPTREAGRDAANVTGEVVDSRTPEAQPREDANASNAAPKDASAQVVDACFDADSDGYCDAEDNCPDDANRDQKDTDGDGIGDVCQPMVVDCDGETVQTGVQVSNSVRVSRVSINGTRGTFARVVAGSTVDMQLDVTFSNCGVAVGPQQIYLGVESAEDPSCESRICTEYASYTVSIPFPLIAPLVPGLHYVLAGAGMAFTCPDQNPVPVPVGTAELSTKVAALCVSAP